MKKISFPNRHLFFCLSIIYWPFLLSGQNISNKDTLRILKTKTLNKINTELELREKEMQKNWSYIDSIRKAIYKSDYCTDKLTKYKIALRAYKNYEDSLIATVRKFNLTSDEYNYYLKINFPWHCLGQLPDKECDFLRLDLVEKATIEKAYKFGNKDGSTGNTYYKRD